MRVKEFTNLSFGRFVARCTYKLVFQRKQRRFEVDMIYIFGGLLLTSFIKQKDVLLRKKRNLVLFLILSACGIALGAVHMISPYIPSITFTLERVLSALYVNR